MEEFVFQLKGPVVSKKNSQIYSRVTGKVGKTLNYRKWYNKAVRQLTAQWELYQEEIGKKIVITEVNFIMFEFTYGSMRRKDTDNAMTSIYDLMTDCGVIKDDSWRELPRGGWKCNYNKGEDSTIVTLSIKKGINK